MLKIIRSTFLKIARNKLFLICNAVFLIYCICLAIYTSRGHNNDYLNGYPFVGFYVFLNTFAILGDEFSAKAIRNKLVIGLSKQKIYLSGLISSTIVSLIGVTVFYSITLLSLRSTNATIPAHYLFINFFINTVNVCYYTTIFTCIIMTAKNSIASLIVSFSLLIVTILTVEFLMFDSYNAAIITILDILPCGQSKQISRFIDYPPCSILFFSTILIFAINSIGMSEFKKSNIK